VFRDGSDDHCRNRCGARQDQYEPDIPSPKRPNQTTAGKPLHKELAGKIQLLSMGIFVPRKGDVEQNLKKSDYFRDEEQ